VFVRPLVRTLLAASFLALAAVAHAAAPAVSVRCEPATLQADENGEWVFTVILRNDAAMGAYGDSVLLDIAPEGGGAAHTQRLYLPAATSPLSAGDSSESRVSIVASAARARLTVRYFAHASDGTAGTASGSLAAAGSVLEDRYPASRTRVGGAAVELVKVPADAGTTSGAGVLVLPGELAEAREMLPAAARLAAQGMNVVLVNAPGRGGSQGPGEADGAAAKAAALAALDTLLRMPGADRERAAAWGVSLGGTLALRLAAEKPAAFRAVVAQSARYDALPQKTAAALKCWTLVLHGERDAVFPAAGAHAFADAVKAAGGTVVPRFLPSGRHALPSIEATRFLQSQLVAN
jgi:predicted esterase